MSANRGSNFQCLFLTVGQCTSQSVSAGWSRFDTIKLNYTRISATLSITLTHQRPTKSRGPCNLLGGGGCRGAQRSSKPWGPAHGLIFHWQGSINYLYLLQVKYKKRAKWCTLLHEMATLKGINPASNRFTQIHTDTVIDGTKVMEFSSIFAA